MQLQGLVRPASSPSSTSGSSSHTGVSVKEEPTADAGLAFGVSRPLLCLYAYWCICVGTRMCSI